MRTIQLAVALFLSVCFQGIASGQYLHFHKNANGMPGLAVYQGNADWLAKQEDPRSHLHELKELTALQLVQHDISLPEMRYVASLKQLRHLMIGQAPEAVKIGQPALSVLSECQWLEDVWICKTNLSNPDLMMLKKLPNLKRVTIEGGDLCKAGAPHGLSEEAALILASIKTLEEVAIRGDAGFSDQSVRELAKLPRLEALELNSSKFTDETLEIITSQMKLRELWIRSPRFTDEGVQVFKEANAIEILTVERDALQ